MSTLQQQAERVRAARAARNWSQKELAEAAHVAPNTIGAIEAGKKVRASNMARVEQALELEPLVEHLWNASLPADIQLILETLGYFLSDFPESERPKVAARILVAMTQIRNDED